MRPAASVFLIEPQSAIATRLARRIDCAGAKVIGIDADCHIERLIALRPDAVVIDVLACRSSDPLELLTAIGRGMPATRLIALASEDLDGWTHACRLTGATVITIPPADEAFVLSLRRALHGDRHKADDRLTALC